MIQSDIFDSPCMNIKKIANIALLFALNRLIEILGIIVSIIGMLLLVSLVTYSPDDPNFIFPDNTQIKNLLGFQGSYISDLFFSIYWFNFILSLFYFNFYWNKYCQKKRFFLNN